MQGFVPSANRIVKLTQCIVLLAKTQGAREREPYKYRMCLVLLTCAYNVHVHVHLHGFVIPLSRAACENANGNNLWSLFPQYAMYIVDPI